jgi:hypothetical protein
MSALPPITTEARRQQRQVKRLVERIKRGQPVSMGAALAVCPYSSLLGRGLVSPDTAPTAVCILLGDPAAGLSAPMWYDTLAALRAGEILLLASDDRALRDRVKAELQLAMATPAGAAEHAALRCQRLEVPHVRHAARLSHSAAAQRHDPARDGGPCEKRHLVGVARIEADGGQGRHRVAG